MNRTEKKQIDDSIGLYHETYRKNDGAGTSPTAGAIRRQNQIDK